MSLLHISLGTNQVFTLLRLLQQFDRDSRASRWRPLQVNCRYLFWRRTGRFTINWLLFFSVFVLGRFEGVIAFGENESNLDPVKPRTTWMHFWNEEETHSTLARGTAVLRRLPNLITHGQWYWVYSQWDQHVQSKELTWPFSSMNSCSVCIIFSNYVFFLKPVIACILGIWCDQSWNQSSRIYVYAGGASFHSFGCCIPLMSI